MKVLLQCQLMKVRVSSGDEDEKMNDLPFEISEIRTKYWNFNYSNLQGYLVIGLE